MKRLSQLLTEAEKLPPHPYILWSDVELSRDVAVPFFNRLIEVCDQNTTMLTRVDSSDLSGTVNEVYLRLNCPRHPVREGMILYGIDALD